jgi:hypothetical protein
MKNYSNFFRPKWSFVKSIPDQVHDVEVSGQDQRLDGAAKMMFYVGLQKSKLSWVRIPSRV